MSQVLERQQHWLTCSQYLPTDACSRRRRGGRRNADCRLDHAASGCSPGVFLSLLRHMATMNTRQGAQRAASVGGAIREKRYNLPDPAQACTTPLCAPLVRPICVVCAPVCAGPANSRRTTNGSARAAIAGEFERGQKPTNCRRVSQTHSALSHGAT